MQRRIFGLETEYGLISSSAGSRVSLSVESAVGCLFERVVSRQRGTNDFLRNGGRLYQDTGCHPEYATPECDSARDLALYDKVGERLVEELLLTAEQRLRETGIDCDLFLFKNNTDSVGNTYGCHENYLVERTVSFHSLAEQLIPFLVTRQVFAGAGKVLRTRLGNHYYLSQRAQHIYQEISGATTSSRGIINTRDEPHADEERFRRLHVIVGDSNMAEVATYLKVGTTAAVLAMLEDGAFRQDCVLEDPVRAIKEISHDPTCRRTVRLRRGGERTALELQREYLEAVAAHSATTEQPPEVTDLLTRWDRVLGQLATDPRQCARELDWVCKWELLEAYRTRKGLAFDDQRLGMLDLQYHDMRRDRGLYFHLEREGYVERLLTDEEIGRALRMPPADTRAYFRGMCLQKFPEQVYGASWSSVLLETGESTVTRVPMSDPTRGTRKLVGEVLERSDSVAELLARLAG
jgi:proteasome accessory factor A